MPYLFFPSRLPARRSRPVRLHYIQEKKNGICPIRNRTVEKIKKYKHLNIEFYVFRLGSMNKGVIGFVMDYFSYIDGIENGNLLLGAEDSG